METTSSPPVEAPPQPGRLAASLGLALSIVGIVAYIVQFAAHVLTVPWYLPILGTIGAAMLLLALVMKPTWVRAGGVLLFGLLAAFEWWLLLSAMVLPPYHGPVTAGKPMPAFHAIQADGKPFTSEDLRDGQGKDTILVFFRGRW